MTNAVIEMNGKETTQVSFLNYTAHEFRKRFRQEGSLIRIQCMLIIKSVSSGKEIRWRFICANDKHLFKN